MEIKDERICGSQTYLRRNHKKAKGTTTDNYAIINEDLSAYLFFILLSNWIKKVHNFSTIDVYRSSQKGSEIPRSG